MDRRRTHTRRRHPAHGVKISPDEPTIVFLTVCSYNRRRWIADPGVHEILSDIWRNNALEWIVGRYVLMPDHLHLFCAPVGDIELDAWVRYWKSCFSRRRTRPSQRWQADHWDTRLRRFESYDRKWDYVRANPVRAGLVEHPDKWPFQGEIHNLEW